MGTDPKGTMKCHTNQKRHLQAKREDLRLKISNKYMFICLFLTSSTVFAGAECKVNGQWYPYQSAECTGQKGAGVGQGTGQETPKPTKQMTQLPSYEDAWKGQRPAALERCAKEHDSLFLQDVCLKNEEKGYMALKSNYNMPSKEAIAAKARCAKTHMSWFLRDVCMKNESKSYQNLYGR
jgi:hypothetical protein